MHNRIKISRVLALILFIGLVFGNFAQAKALVIDSKVPKFKTVSVDKTEVTLGETVNVNVTMTKNELKSVKNVYMVYVNEATSLDRVKEVKFDKNEDGFSGKIKITEDFTNGLWKPDFIVFSSEKEGSSIVYNSDVHEFDKKNSNCLSLSNGNFLVKEFADYKLFKDVSVDYENVKKLDVNRLVVEVNDVEVDLEEKAYALYILENEFGYFEKEIKLNLKGNSYEAAILIDENFTQGDWKLNYIVLKDKTGHSEIVYNKEIHGTMVNDTFVYLAKGNFTVQSDNMGPKLKSMSIDMNDNVPGLDKVYEITLEAEDESELYEKAYVSYITLEDDLLIPQEIVLEKKDGKYHGIFTRKNDSLALVDFILFKDVEGNTTTIYNELLHSINGADLSALNVYGDAAPPTVDGIEIIDHETNGEYTIVITPSEDESGLAQNAYLVYEAVNGEEIIEGELVLELQGGVYTKNFRIGDFEMPLTWNISNIILSDMNGNTGIYYNNVVCGNITNSIDMSAGTFNTSGDDVIGPTVTSLNMTSGDIEITNNIETVVDVSITADDVRSELYENAYIVLRSNSGKTKELKLALENDSYVGNFRFDESNVGETWSMDYLLVQDELLNKTIIYNSAIHGIGIDLSGYDIKVNGVKISIDSVEKDMDMDLVPRSAKISAKATGIAGSTKGYALFFNEFGEEVELRLEGQDGNVNGVWSDIQLGYWRLSFIIVGDDFGNTEILYNSDVHGYIMNSKDMTHMDIAVQTKIPVIKDVIISSNTLELFSNERAAFRVIFEDPEAVGDVAYVKYIGENVEGEFKLEKVDGTFTGMIGINEETPDTTIKVDYIVVADLDGVNQVIYNSDVHGIGQDFSNADIRIKNPDIGLDVVDVQVDPNSVDLGEKVAITVKVGESAFALSENAYINYTKNFYGIVENKEVILTKVDERTYTGEVSFEDVADLGMWNVDFVILSDIEGNRKITYNNREHVIGTDLVGASIRVGEFAVREFYSGKVPGTTSGIDRVAIMAMESYIDETRRVSVLTEIFDINGELISKVKINKVLNAYGSSVTESRIKIKDNAFMYNMYILDENGEVLYTLYEGELIK